MPDYERWATDIKDGDRSCIIAHLQELLTTECIAEYKQMTPHVTNIVEVTFDTFTYLYDHYGELETRGDVPYSKDIEDRLVAAYGTSKSPVHVRETSRIRGWVGPTERFLGMGRDKGHFIAHCIGGRVDGFEINVFPQAVG